MGIDIKESATRKLGPLPVWGWAIAVAGAVIGVRLLRGGSATSGTPTVVGGSGLTSDLSSADFQGELADLADETAGLSDSIGNFSAFDALQQQLNAAMLSRTNIDRQISGKRDQIANIKSLYRTKKITRAQYDKRIAIRKSELAAINAQSTTVNATITNLQKEIAGIGT